MTSLINVYIPFIEIYLQIEVAQQSTLRELGTLIEKVTENDTPLKIFRFKYENTLLSMSQKIGDIIQSRMMDPKKQIYAYIAMIGA